jgi:hypothetical protein
MSYLPSNLNFNSFIPFQIRASAPAAGWPGGWSQSNVFPIETGTKGVSIRLNHNASTTQSYYLRLMYSIEVEPNVPGGFDFVRKDIYFAGPPSFYGQDIYQIGFINIASVSGGTLNGVFPIEFTAAKWGLAEVACSNTAGVMPSISLQVSLLK